MSELDLTTLFRDAARTREDARLVAEACNVGTIKPLRPEELADLFARLKALGAEVGSADIPPVEKLKRLTVLADAIIALTGALPSITADFIL